jgi:1-phosphofructokinase
MTSGVMVLAPAPQLTVTIEQFADKPELHLHAGGQGVWQARMIRSLDVPVVFCTLLGDGEVGSLLTGVLAKEDLDVRAIRSSADNGWYVHDRRGDERQVVAEYAGPQLGRHDADELYALTLAEGLKSGFCLLSGPAHPSLIPAAMYQRLAIDLQSNGAKVAADLSGEHLEAVLESGPEFLKVSDEELYADELADQDDGERGLVKAIRKLRDRGAGTIVVTRAEKPSIVLIDDEPELVHPPSLMVAEHRGAGDSLTAAAVAVLAKGGDARTAVRTGTAAGALNVTRHGLGTGRSDAIDALVELVRFSRMEEA